MVSCQSGPSWRHKAYASRCTQALYWNAYYYKSTCFQFSSVAQLCLTLCDSMDCSTASFLVTHQLDRACLWSRTGHQTISSSVIPFSSFLQSFPASGSFPMSQLFTSGGHIIRASASASVLPVNLQCWFPLGWTGLISLQSKGLSRVFSNTTV